MRAVKCKDNQISLINGAQARLFNLAEISKLKAIDLSERDAYIAEEMYQQNIFKKSADAGIVCSTTYSAKQEK